MLALVLALAAVASSWVAGVAWASEPGFPPPRDRVLRQDEPLAFAAAASYRSYPDGDGHTVRIDAGTYSDATAREVAAELGELVHGDEMNELSVRLVTPLEMQLICGSGSLACYAPGPALMVLDGTDYQGRPSRTFLMAHEYGHHVAENRTNAPWFAGNWGTKRWASYEQICRLAERGVALPGSYSRRGYWRNPGEAFAEAYAFMHFPRGYIRWEWSIAKPDQGAYDAISDDVLDPWTARETLDFSGEITSSESRVAQPVTTALDGSFSVRLEGPPAAELDLRLLDSQGRVLRTSRDPGSEDRLSYKVCGQRTVEVQVVARSGAGDYDLVVRRP